MNRKTLAAGLTLLLVAGGCDQSPQIRKYTEIHREPEASPLRDPHAGLSVAVDPSMRTQDPTVQAMLDKSVAETALKWTAPEGWSEEPGSGMRLVTFTGAGPDPVTCTIISLGGTSGGLEANAVRWARQLQISLTPEDMHAFLESAGTITGDGGLDVQVLDFRRLQEGLPAGTPSMTAGLLTLPDKTVFLKMTGSLEAVTANQENFNTLLRSLRLP